MAMLEAKDLSIEFGGIKAVTDFNLSVNPGELVAIIGPNGAGKTTVFNMLTGIYRPSAGSILLNEKSIIGKKPYKFNHLGIARTFQNIRLFSEASVIDNIKMAVSRQVGYSFADAMLWTKKFKKEEARIQEFAMSLLTEFGLAPKAYMRAKNLAYGEQRRLEIARALAANPQILLLDEPVAGMNPGEIKEMINLIARAREKYGVAIILIEHHMSVVMSIAERITVLEFGKTIAEGTPESIRANTAVIKAYLGGEVSNA